MGRRMQIEEILIKNLKPAEYKLGWLAGIFDGEGSFGLKRTRDKRLGRRPINYSPLIQITNCDVSLIKEVDNILRQLKIKTSKWKRIESRNIKWRDSYNIAITSQASSIDFLRIIIPYLVSKKEHAEILLSFCEYRQKEQRLVKSKYHAHYGKKEHEFWERLHKLNYKGKR